MIRPFRAYFTLARFAVLREAEALSVRLPHAVTVVFMV